MVAKYGIKQVSTGDILREQIASDTPLGRRAHEYVSKGSLVPDGVILEMMEQRLAQDDLADGFLLDGFPRSIPQAEGLDRILKKAGVRLDAVIKLDLPKKVLLERLTARRVCSKCQAVYNSISSPPRVDGVCDRCGGKLIAREDDTEETVRRRLNVYEATTAPLIDYYDARGLLVIVSGDGPIDQVEAAIDRALEGIAAKGR
jgi:adenylate kinase